MSADKGFHDYVMHDVLAGISGVTSRAMFGGWGIYRSGKIFAIIAEGVLYFKVGDNNQADYQAAGSKPFTYQGARGEPYQMGYWELPDEVASNKHELEAWIEKSLEAKSAKKKSVKGKRP